MKSCAILLFVVVILVACGKEKTGLTFDEVKTTLESIYTRSELVKEFGAPGAIVKSVEKVNTKYIYCDEDFDIASNGFLGFTVLLAQDGGIILWRPLFIEEQQLIEGV
ncbi:hypothetical protein P4C99_18090 [Pontiellaceae bacterium B1224]|nr:hypothetical protein [Pontiellaceae bacterium B1224]